MLILEIALGVFIGGLAIKYHHAAILLIVSLLGLALALVVIGIVGVAAYATWPDSGYAIGSAATIAASLYGLHLLDNASDRILSAWRRWVKPDV